MRAARALLATVVAGSVLTLGPLAPASADGFQDCSVVPGECLPIPTDPNTCQKLAAPEVDVDLAAVAAALDADLSAARTTITDQRAALDARNVEYTRVVVTNHRLRDKIRALREVIHELRD